MSFLVILICLTINYLWLKDLDRFDDSWFFKFRCKIEAVLKTTVEDKSLMWVVNGVLIYGLPMLVLGIASWFADGRGLGIPTMVIHILVLLVAFDRTQPGQLAADFLSRWGNKDFEGAKLYLQQELPAPDLGAINHQQELLDYFCKRLVYRCFEKMFVMFFWYMIAGPWGVLFCYISYQLRDIRSEDQAADLVELVSIFLWVLEWVPMRLLAVTFSLAGNFVQCFESVKESFWSLSMDLDNAAMLYSYSGCALPDSTDQNGSQSWEGRSRVEALQALLERSQAIWLGVLALITLFGL